MGVDTHHRLGAQNGHRLHVPTRVALDSFHNDLSEVAHTLTRQAANHALGLGIRSCFDSELKLGAGSSEFGPCLVSSADVGLPARARFDEEVRGPRMGLGSQPSDPSRPNRSRAKAGGAYTNSSPTPKR